MNKTLHVITRIVRKGMDTVKINRQDAKSAKRIFLGALRGLAVQKRVYRLAFVLLCVLMLVACEEQATPFPVDLPSTPTPTPPPEALPPLRYALAPAVGDRVPDWPLLQNSYQMIALDTPVNPADLGTVYDLVVTYGTPPSAEWTQTTLTPRVSLVIHSQIPPFDDPNLRALLVQSLDTQPIIAALNIPGAEAQPVTPLDVNVIRTRLANDGLPDGVAFVLGETFVPGAAIVADQMRSANFEALVLSLTPDDLRTAFEDGRVQAALIAWTVETERARWVTQFGDDAVLDLYTTPLSYRALPELTITFTPAGWPLPQR